MTFAFFKAARKAQDKGPQRPVARGVASLSPQNKAALARLGCRACPLDKADCVTPKMGPTIAHGETMVLVLAEAPGRDEDENTGRPLTGPSGSLIRGLIPEDMLEFASFDNVINCRPPKNRTPVPIEIECCRPRRIKVIERTKPIIILGLGAVPMNAILGSSDLRGLRGRVFAVRIGGHDCYFLGTYHPSYLLRNAYDKNRPLQSRLGHCFRMDVLKAFRLAKVLEHPTIFTEAKVRDNIITIDGHGQQDYDQVLRLIDKAKAAPEKAVDFETKNLSPWREDSAVMTIAISFGDTNFSFAVDHPEAGWTSEERNTIINEFAELCEDDTLKIAHNAPFEIEWLIKLSGRRMVNHGAWRCTQMQAHFLDERKGDREDESNAKASKYQALNFLVKQHFNLSFKHLFKLNKKDMSKSPLSETLIYNGADTKHTLPLYHHQKRLLKQAGLWGAYLDATPRQPTVALMQSIGVPIDQKAVKTSQKKLSTELASLETDIYSQKVVKQFIKDKREFNWASQPNVLTLFKDYLHRHEVVVRDKSGAERQTVNKNVLDQIDHPLAKLIVNIRNRAKMKSTYVDGMEAGKGALIYPDGKIHPNFNTTFTETGRLSSDDPNAQNYPKRNDVWVRKQLVPPPGHLLVAIDFGQLEACTLAMCSRDPYLVKVLWEDYDTHMEWAVKAAHKIPGLIGGKSNMKDTKIMKDFRSLIKNKLVFPAFFGAVSESVRNYLHAATGFDADQADVDDIMDEFWSTFAGTYQWQKDTMSQYYDKGYVETLVGRRHHYPLSKNQAINMPVQGTAAEMVCDAMCRLSLIASDNEKWHLQPVLNIHDDLTFLIPDDDKILDEALRIISREMLTFGYGWINVPLSIEISIGKNWCDVQPLGGKLWSHKEFDYPKKEINDCPT